MQKTLKAFTPFLLLSVLVLAHLPAVAEELDMVNRPVNTYGLTGLMFTTAPYTLAPGTVEVGASIISENSITPPYTVTQYPLTVSLGVGSNSELALRGSYYRVSEGATGESTRRDVTGNVELAYKWNFLPPEEDSPRPALSFIAAGSLPTEKHNNVNVDSVTQWGMRLGISAGSEINWKEHVFGIYADAQVAGQDPTEARLRNIYQLANLGFLLPISKYQNLQMFLEYNVVQGNDIVSFSGADYSGITYGLRLVSERYKMTIGTQFVHKQTTGYENSNRVGGVMSMKF